MDGIGEWELSKENIQPLRQGRKFTALRKALTPRKDDNLEKQRQLFETELRTYEGDDPIELWLQYIEWVEQNYPKGGRDGNVYQLLERCIGVLQENQKYRNDIRYLSVCLKYANMSSNSLEIFNFMYDQNIGCGHADFYKNWAWTLEQLGDLRRAIHVLDMGIQRRAHPVESLEETQRHLQLKFAKAVLENDKFSSGMLDAAEDQRAALAALKPKGIKHRAPVSRTGTARLDLKVRLPSSSSNTITPATSRSTKGNVGAFHVFTDGNALSENTGTKNTKEKVALPPGTNAKENERMPGKWSKIKHLPERTAPFSHSTATRVTTEFPIHEDENSGPSKPAVVLPKESNVLSSKRIQWDVAIAVFEPPDPKKRPMYCKRKVYGGNTEFSFEEIRAAKWFANQKKMAEEKEMEAMKRKVLELEQQLTQLKATTSTNTHVQNKIPKTKAPIPVKKKANVPHQETRSTEQFTQEEYKNSLLSVDAAFPNHSIMQSPTVHTREAYQLVGALWEGTICHVSSSENSNVFSQNECVAEQPRKEPSFSVFCDPTQTIPLKNAADLPKGQLISKFQECMEPGGESDENKENIAAAGYIQMKDSRIKTGILQPSVGVLCGPPEEIDDDISDDDDVLEGINPLAGDDDDRGNDFTLPPLCNTANFAAHPALLSSTPFIQNKQGKVKALQHCSSDDKSQSSSTVAMVNLPNAGRTAFCQVTVSEGENSLDKQESTAACKGNFIPNNLSIIVETSRENTKSSSSSSSHSTVPSINNSDRTSLNSVGKSLRDSTGRISKSVLSHCSQRSCAMAEEEKENLINDACVRETHTADSNAASGTCENLSRESLPLNPFDSSGKREIVCSLKPPLNKRKGYCEMLGNLPCLKPEMLCKIDGKNYLVISMLGKGAIGKVYKVRVEDLNVSDLANESPEQQFLAFKVVKPADPWEFYICSELHERLKKLNKSHIANAIVRVHKYVAYKNGCILMEEFCQYRSILDFVNLYRNKNLPVPECMAMYFTLELMIVVSQLHICGVIHADLKPDNILIKALPLIGSKESIFKLDEALCICLIDFGQSIDMTCYPPGTTFNHAVKTRSFQCPEMLERLPWTYQTDLFCIAATIHLMLFGSYMAIRKNSNGRWEPKTKLKRYWQNSIWQPLLDTLLNVPDCAHIPDLTPFIDDIKQYLHNKYTALTKSIYDASHLLSKYS